MFIICAVISVYQFCLNCCQCCFLYILDKSNNFIKNMSSAEVKLKPDLSRKNLTSNWSTFLKNTTTSVQLEKKPKQIATKDTSTVNSIEKNNVKFRKHQRKRNIVKENCTSNVNPGTVKNGVDTETAQYKPIPVVKRYGLPGKRGQIVPVPASHLVVRDADFLTQSNLIGERGVRPIFDKSPCVAIDCEMVGIQDGTVNMLARVSLVNIQGKCIYDTFVKAEDPVIDYRTSISGVRQSDMENGADFSLVRSVVATLIHSRILIGHAISNDLYVLGLKFPRKRIRDTSKYKLLRTMVGGGTPSLKKLSYEILHINIQDGEHSSVEDARATMKLYLKFRKEWEETYLKK